MVGAAIGQTPERAPHVGGSCVLDLWGSLLLREPSKLGPVPQDTGLPVLPRGGG